ncbi:MAG: glycosyltransferase family 4 protein [Patescibacteria group bacterium]
MKIGLLLPSALMYEPLSDGKIFAPKELFLDLADGLVARGHEVRVYSSSDTKTRATLVAGDDMLALGEPPAMKMRYVGVETKRLLARRDARWEYELDLTSRAYADARAGRLEIIHSFLEFSAHYFESASGTTTVYTLHDGLPQKNSLDAWRLRRFPHDAYVAISENQARNLGGLIDIAGVVYHGLHASRYEPNFQSGDYLLFIGRYMPEKGLEDALRVGMATGTLTVLAGSKEYQELAYFREKIAPLLSHPLVKQVGFLKGRRKAGLLAGAKALLFPIHWEEPFGLVMIEAMACGTPVIAYNRGSVSEIVRDGVTGFIVEPEPSPDHPNLPDHPDFVIKKRGIEGLVEAVRRIGEIDRAACRRHVEENFTVDKMVEGYERVYQKVLASKG